MMYHIFLLLITALPCLAQAHMSFQPYEILVTPLWQNLERDTKKQKKFKSSWIIAASITFKNRSHAIFTLPSLEFSWHSPHDTKIDHLHASLFNGNVREFIPDEDHLIAEGFWNKRTQHLTFMFKNSLHLASSTTLYLVFTVPHKLKPVLEQGHFDITKELLPWAYTKLPHSSFEIAYSAPQNPNFY